MSNSNNYNKDGGDNKGSDDSWRRCDFSSRDFVLKLFNFCLELTRTKIASDLIQPVPQVRRD